MRRTSSGRQARLILPAIAGVAALALAGCAADSATEAAPEETAAASGGEFFDLLPENIQEAGVLRIGVSANFPPGNFEDVDGDLDGSEIQLGFALGEVLGVEIEHVTTNFAGLLTGLEANRFDVVLSGMSDTLEREQQVDFINYINTGSNFLVPEGNPNDIETPEDLCGLTAAETIGTTYIDIVTGFSEDCVAAGNEPIEVQTYQSGPETTQAVSTGRADFSFASMMAHNYFASQSNGALESVGETYNPQLTGIVVPKGSEQLIEALQAALQSMVDSGQTAEIMAEWGLEDQILDPVQVNGATS
ncbi:ABC transporter substrate-binding protein [Agromyces silvae]|uniref:ABC transporter substrate-binding protein n=1 Tax=Agromyces silvae TaxID=3388266 RepID=UPI00280A9B7C|nr:ABC transporter substrate-binding protein [Agromyces protaetiae]